MSEWRFILAVLIFYGIIFAFYSISNGSIAGLPTSNLVITIPPAPTGNAIMDFINGAGYFITQLASFFYVLLVPFSDLAIFTPINWGLLGTTIYLFLKMIRGN